MEVDGSVQWNSGRKGVRGRKDEREEETMENKRKKKKEKGKRKKEEEMRGGKTRGLWVGHAVIDWPDRRLVGPGLFLSGWSTDSGRRQ